MTGTLELEAENKSVLANSATLHVLERIKPLLTAWPAVLPTAADPVLKPLAIGIDKAILALLIKPAIDVVDGMKATARINPKSYRKALAAIEEHGAENVAVIVQGNMVKSGVIESAGIVAQPKKPKA